MRLTVNGCAHDHRGDGTLAALLVETGAADRPVAVMVNGEVVDQARRAGWSLREGDIVEILIFAGGG
jgi:thiamine biosynthesis protein ThiS